MFADHVHDRTIRPPGIMQARDPVGKAGAKVQKGHCRPREHTPVPLGRAGAYALEKTEHGPYPGLSVKRRNHGYLCRSRIGKTYFDTVCDSSFKDHIRTGHWSSMGMFL